MGVERSPAPRNFEILQPEQGENQKFHLNTIQGLDCSGVIFNIGKGQDAIGYKVIDQDKIVMCLSDGLANRTDSREAARLTVENAVTGLVNPLSNLARDTNTKVRNKLDRWGAATMIVALFEKVDNEWQISVINVGDSRGYLVHDEEITQITEDDEGDGNGFYYINRFIGMPEERFEDPHIYTKRLIKGDTIFLMSDGVYEYYNELTIVNKSRSSITASDFVRPLRKSLRRSKQNSDDLSVIMVRVTPL